VKITEHWDGSVDATVKLTSLRLSFAAGATPDPVHVAAIHELEAATREHILAKNSDTPRWLRFTKARLAAAKQRMLEVQ